MRALLIGCLLAVLAGCGSGSSSPAAPATSSSNTESAPSAAPPAIVRSIPVDAASRAYVAHADAVCAADLVGFPAVLKSPYTSTSVTQYAAAAAPPVRRTVLALARLHAPKPLVLAAKGMVRAYGQLLPLYAAVAGALANASTGRSAADKALLIFARQGTATALAGAAGLASCQFRSG